MNLGLRAWSVSSLARDAGRGTFRRTGTRRQRILVLGGRAITASLGGERKRARSCVTLMRVPAPRYTFGLSGKAVGRLLADDFGGNEGCVLIAAWDGDLSFGPSRTTRQEMFEESSIQSSLRGIEGWATDAGPSSRPTRAKSGASDPLSLHTPPSSRGAAATESVLEKNRDSISPDGLRVPPTSTLSEIALWARSQNIDAVVWTSLPPKFGMT